MLKRTPLKKQSKLPLSTLKRKAIKVFNAWIRERDKGKGCYTCGSRDANQAGHFIHSKNSVRFDPMNVHIQCNLCNQYKSGNLGEYALRLIQDYGLEEVKKLKRRANELKRFSKTELEEIITTYQ